MSAYQFDLELREGDHELRVTGSAYPHIPAKGPTLEDPGSPAEGGEIEDLAVYLLHGMKERRLCDAVASKLDLAEKIHDAIADGAEDFGEE